MKLAPIFFTASESIFAIYGKDTNKRARNMKLVSIFFTASESIFVIYDKDTTYSNNPSGKLNFIKRFSWSISSIKAS